MKPLACRYAIVQFMPYAETGEFANVGVVLACPQTGYFDFKLQTRRYARVTAFFDELHRDVYVGAIKTMQSELERIQRMVASLPASADRPDQIHASFPLVQRLEGQVTKVIKPFNLAQHEANAIYAHGDAWLQKVRRLRKRNLLPRDIRFALAVPPQSDAKRRTCNWPFRDRMTKFSRLRRKSPMLR